MARSIITCDGVQIDIGQKVKTKGGRVIRVEGAALGMEFHNAEECTPVGADVPTTKELEDRQHHDANKAAGGGDEVKPVSGGQRASDCIIWGT